MSTIKAAQHFKSLSWVYPYGKYRGYPLEDVVELDPHYVRWCCDELPGFRLDPTARAELEVNEENMAESCGPFNPIEEYDHEIPEFES